MTPVRSVMVFDKPRDSGIEHNLRLLALVVKGNDLRAVPKPLSEEFVKFIALLDGQYLQPHARV